MKTIRTALLCTVIFFSICTACTKKELIQQPGTVLFADSTGRQVAVPNAINRVVPAGTNVFAAGSFQAEALDMMTHNIAAVKTVSAIVTTGDNNVYKKTP